MSFNNRNDRRDRHSGGSGGGGGGGGGGYRYSGGGGNNNRGNRNFERDYGSNFGRNSAGNSGVVGGGLNPWASSSTVDSRPSLLPTPGSGNILSQLTNTITSPEAQLLMASNLLSKLFTPGSQAQNNVSSLLNMSGLGSNYGHNNYTPRDMDRGRNFNSNRSGPYNKSSMGRRNQPNNKPRNSGNSGNSGPQNRRSRPSSSPAKSLKKSDNDTKDSSDKKRKEETKKEPEERKPQSKEEKNAIDLPKTTSSFTGIPKAILYCYVCHKHMWDDTSFENHVKGRPHEWMLSKLDESNKLVVDLLRHQVRTNEEQRRMKFQRSAKKKNRNSGNMKCEFCAMCDVDIRGSLAAHRRNYLHLKLKRFLHPRCLTCKKEFHNRLDFNLHKISADHLKALADKRRERRPDLKDDDYDLEDFIVLDDVGGSYTWGGDEACISGEIKVSTKIDAEEDIEETKVKIKDEGDVEMKEDGKEDDDGENRKDRDDSKLPTYNPAAAVGPELMVDVSGKFCRACYRFMKTDADANIHCRTVTHYENYRNLVKLQHIIVSDRKSSTVKVEGENGVKKEGGEEDEDDGEDVEDEEAAEEVEGNEEDNDVVMENGTVDSEKEKQVKVEVEVEVNDKEEGKDEEVNDEIMTESKDESMESKEKDADESTEGYDPHEPTEDSTESENTKSPAKASADKPQPQRSQPRARRGTPRKVR